MNKEDCSHVANCSAVMCPLDDDLTGRLWYPMEPICRNRQFHDLVFIKKQHKLHHIIAARKTYFTYEMLVRNCTYRKTMTGINPKGRYAEQYEVWCRLHPVRKALSKTEIKRRTDRTKGLIEKRWPKKS
jgi:hypothetical protein